jgi:hypothetical protein
MLPLVSLLRFANSASCAVTFRLLFDHRRSVGYAGKIEEQFRIFTRQSLHLGVIGLEAQARALRFGDLGVEFAQSRIGDIVRLLKRHGLGVVHGIPAAPAFEACNLALSRLTSPSRKLLASRDISL